MPPMINQEKCVECGTCVQICPLDVIRYQEDEFGKKYVVVKYPYECWHCRACVKDCPQGAMTMRYPLSHMIFHMEVEKKEIDEKNVKERGAESWA